MDDGDDDSCVMNHTDTVLFDNYSQSTDVKFSVVKVCTNNRHQNSPLLLGLGISAPAMARIRHFSKSGRNPVPKIPPEPDSFAGFEKSIFPRHQITWNCSSLS